MLKQILSVSIAVVALNSQAKIAGIVDVKTTLKSISKQIYNINTQELIDILDEDPNVMLIDVRAKHEINASGSIKRGQNINIMRGTLENDATNHIYSKDTPIIVYCLRNLRSPFAAKTLEDMGYTNVKNYADGFITWKNKQLPIEVNDHEPGSFLYRLPVKVAEGVYSAIGATQPNTYENSNHNNNLSFIVTSDGVLVFNAGGSYLLAQALHEEIKKITKKKVKYVVLENSQGHAILGSNYWKEQGATIVAHLETDKVIKSKGKEIYNRALKIQKDKFIGTKIVRPDFIFTENVDMSMGHTKIELMHIGPSHSPDDIQLWMPKEKILISGDTAFNERMLPIFPHTHTEEWIETWDLLEALEPKIVIPGHGNPTDFATVTKFTKDYLVYMRSEVEKILDNDGDLNDAYNIDQTMFRDRGTYKELNRQNVERIFNQMEFE
jgi:rhodanese-related sulfurtransferase/glyoxylase-like metal-dependent hydrolase (beta-lactamase superfamily II)